MSSNSSKKRPSDGEERQNGTASRNQVKLDRDMNTRPSKSILPPESPGSVQEVALFDAEDFSAATPEYGYMYPKLAAREFRLLRLHPGHGDETPHCSLVVDNIDEPSSYEALSYVWGDSTITQPILLSDEESSASFSVSHSFNVTVNLYSALLHLRLPERPLVLWVDALCINQDDVREKNQQIPMMGKIFQESHRVLVWLGPSDPATDFMLSNLHRAFQPGFFSVADGAVQRRIPPRISPSSLCKSLEKLLRNDFWSRIWIIQEIMLAPMATIVLGKRQVDLEDIRTAVELCQQTCSTISSQVQNSGTSSLGIRRALRLLGARQSLWHISSWGDIVGHRLPLVDILARFHDFESSDPRDMIYAVLSMARPDTIIDVDYNKTKSEVYLETAKAIIEESRSMDWVIPHMFPRSGTPELPSWTPDWSLTSLPSHWSVTTTVGSRPTKKYNACGDRQMEWKFEPLLSKRKRLNGQELATQHDGGESALLLKLEDCVLHMTGIKLGVITDLSTRIVDGLISRDALEMAGMPFTGGCETLRQIHPQQFHSLWKTLVADRDADDNPAPTRFSLALKHLFQRIIQSRSLDIDEILEDEDDANIRTFLKQVRVTTDGRRLFTSTVNELEERLLGHVPRAARVRDTIAILFGSSVPFVLRESKLGHGYVQLIGPAYVDGIMDGEVLSKLSKDRVEDSFQII